MVQVSVFDSLASLSKLRGITCPSSGIGSLTTDGAYGFGVLSIQYHVRHVNYSTTHRVVYLLQSS